MKTKLTKDEHAVSRRDALAALGGGIGAVGATILAGCGSGGGASSTNTALSNVTGRSAVTIVWPDRAASRLIPVAAASIVIRFVLGDQVVATQTVVRPTNGNTSTVTFDALPIGTLTVQAEARPNAGGTGTAQASAVNSLVIASGQTTPLTLTMASTIDHVNLLTYDSTIKVGTSTALQLTALDASGNTVLITTSTVTFTALTPAIATVDAAGTITGVSVGTASFRGIETESGKSATVTLPVTAAPTPTPSPSPSTGSCTVIPTDEEGPFPLYSVLTNSIIRRSNITEGKTGVPLTLNLTFVNTSNSCGLLSNAAIYIWQCDKNGEYSGYSSNQNGNHAGETYLRGVQTTDSSGKVSFTTIYPGWYAGRITHIHIEVFLNNSLTGNAKATSQLAFPQNITQAVYNSTLYAAHGQNTSVTSFAQDHVFSDGTTYQMLTITGDTTNGFVATLVIGIAAG